MSLLPTILPLALTLGLIPIYGYELNTGTTVVFTITIGMCVPVLLQQAYPIKPSGLVLIAGIAGGGGPATLFAQFVYTDAAQPQGLGFSNALQIDVLP